MSRYELIVTVINRGFADDVMDAAKRAGAFGGTVINGRGTGSHEQQKFFGAIVQPEKELVLILTGHDDRAAIMEAIGLDAGLSKKGTGICFSLPVDSVVGISRFEEPKDNEKGVE